MGGYSIAGRIGGEKTRCSGAWTEAKFTSFVKGNLRRTSMKWAPIGQALKAARTKRGFYHCACCQQEVPSSVKEEGSRRRTKNVHVDHIDPIIDPAVGWTNWDDCINRMFSELDNLQVLCGSCHKVKTDKEKQVAKERRAQQKLENTNDE